MKSMVIPMLEYFPETIILDTPECMLCHKDLHKGETVIELQQGYICMGCRAEAVFKGAARDDLVEFITSNNLEERLASWFYEPHEQEL